MNKMFSDSRPYSRLFVSIRGQLQNRLPFGQSMSAHVQNLDDATDYSIHFSL